MHFNILAVAVCVLSATDSVYAHPSSRGLGRRGADLDRRAAYPSRISRRSQIASLQQLACTLPPAAGQEEAAAGEGEGEGNEVEIESAFDVATAVVGGELKQDLVFTPSTVGKFEYEFQAAAADEVTVTEKVGGAIAPAGFEAIEPNSYVVALAVSKGAGLTLSKIDYIFDPASAGLAGKDITTAQVGRLCPETGAFVISETLGELEFEAEEAEVTLNLNKNVTAEGEWGIFLPVAAAAAAPAAPAAGKGKGKATRQRTETARDGSDSDDED